MSTVLVTGFGPFPGAPFNPTGSLVARLARLRRPGLSGVTIVGHVFATSYAAVDSELPWLIARHRPDVLLMFGLAARTRMLRIETRARNALALLPDVAGGTLRRSTIATGAAAALAMPAPTHHLLAAVRTAGVPARLSRDAGKYLCNYLIWRAAEAAAKPGGPHLAAFVHVPEIGRVPRRRGKRKRFSHDRLFRAGTQVLTALIAAARR